MNPVVSSSRKNRMSMVSIREMRVDLDNAIFAVGPCRRPLKIVGARCSVRSSVAEVVG